MRRFKLLAPLRHRDFRLLWSGMTVSLLGDGMFLVALAWQAYEISDTPTALSVIGVAMTVPHVVLLLIGGVVSDRFDRRRVMMAADGVRAAALFAMGTLAVAGTLRLWHMLVIAAVFGAGTAFFGPSFDAIVPELVPTEELPQANSLDQFVRPAASRLVGPAIGGWTIALLGGHAGPAFIVDAATFAVSVICILAMRSHPVERQASTASVAHEIREGFRFVRSRVWLWGTFLAATLAYLIFWGPSEVLLPFVVKNHLHGSARDLGLILALGGVGAMTSALVMGNREVPKRSMTFMYLVWTVSTLAIAGYGLATFTWQLMLACFVFNALEGAGTIVWATTKQRLVPGRLLGRVSSFDWFISIGLVPVSFALTGPMVALLGGGVHGARTTLVGAGMLGGVVTLAFLFLPGMRAVERDPGMRAVERDPGMRAVERDPEMHTAKRDAEMPALEGPAAEPEPRLAPEPVTPYPPAPVERILEPEAALVPARAEPFGDLSLREAFAALAVAEPDGLDALAASNGHHGPAEPARTGHARPRLGDTWAFPARG